jgi:hypothetical protein
MLGVFRASACLTEEEDVVLNDWARGKSIVETAMTRSMSDRKVGRIRKTLRRKYDNIQPYTDLPKRSKQ